jgi:beta-phosphoglucomutase-like phosphatase (HAD superfamily)
MYIIYCDMDGVLVDFEKGYYDLTGVYTKQFAKIP